MSIAIRLYGALAVVSGTETMNEAAPSDVEALRHRVLHQFPELKKFNMQIAVNRRITDENMQLKAGDEVAFLPPYSGG